jgi:hypothetical protein
MIIQKKELTFISEVYLIDVSQVQGCSLTNNIKEDKEMFCLIEKTSNGCIIRRH